jgi:hypothetical protein
MENACITIMIIIPLETNIKQNMSINHPHHRSSSKGRQSVRFNLDNNTICKYEAEYSVDAYWYNDAEVRSMLVSTARNAAAYRQLIVALRSIRERADQRRVLVGIFQEQDVCTQGIEHLVSSVSLRRRLVSTVTHSMSMHTLQFLPASAV